MPDNILNECPVKMSRLHRDVTVLADLSDLVDSQ